MTIESVFDPAFAPYGKVLEGYDTAALLETLQKVTPVPEGVEYVPSQPELEALPIAGQLSVNAYGGMPIQLGWCNGHNTKLNCLEYHRDSELNCGAQDFILLLAREDEMEGGMLDTAKVKAFRVPAGALVEVYATTLHYSLLRRLRRRFPGGGGAPPGHQRSQAGPDAAQRRGRDPYRLQQVAACPSGLRRGQGRRQSGAAGRKYRHRKSALKGKRRELL